METPEKMSISPTGVVSSPISEQDHRYGTKAPGYSQTRRPAGGSSRPLPSPGKNVCKIPMYPKKWKPLTDVYL